MNNWLLIIVGVIFLVSAVAGAARGFFKIGLSLLSSVITVVIVTFLTPYIGEALAKYTPLDEMIESQCVEAFIPELSEGVFEGKDLSGTPFANLDPDMRRNFGDIDWDRLGITVDDLLDLIGEIPRDQQIKAIEESNLPEFMKEMLMENNNSAIYDELGVSNFPRYVAEYISRMAIKIISFLVTFLIAIIFMKALMVAVDILGELPVLGTMNHFCGALVGLFVGILFVWLLFLVITLAYATEIGGICFDLIEQSAFLSILYEWNPLMLKLLSF